METLRLQGQISMAQKPLFQSQFQKETINKQSHLRNPLRTHLQLLVLENGSASVLDLFTGNLIWGGSASFLLGYDNIIVSEIFFFISPLYLILGWWSWRYYKSYDFSLLFIPFCLWVFWIAIAIFLEVFFPHVGLFLFTITSYVNVNGDDGDERERVHRKM